MFFSLNYAVLSVKNNNSGSHLLKAYDMPGTVLGGGGVLYVRHLI